MTSATSQITPELSASLLVSAHDRAYEDFVGKHAAGMLCYCLAWRDIIAATTGARPLYQVCIEGNDLVGVMPAFLLETPHGNVLNALPFYGFHGQPLCRPDHPEAATLLLDSFDRLAREHECITATVVENPLVTVGVRTLPDEGEDAFDFRAAQIVRLPESLGEDDLVHFFEGRTRTAIRKAIKEGVTVGVETESAALDRVRQMHEDNCADLGIVPKPARFFDAVRDRMTIGVDYDIYTATRARQEIAHLLLFYYADKVEYFTPAVSREHRHLQPLSLLIFEGMKRAVAAGYRYWNFGGTAAGQDGVYKFKRSWGAEGRPYRYRTRIYDHAIRRRMPDELLRQFPYFYVIPFAELKKS